LIGIVEGHVQMPEFTEMMQAAESGDWVTAEKLLPVVYDEMRKLAASCLAQEPAGHGRQATSLVHDAWLRLIGIDGQTAWRNEGHFFGAAAIAIRRILVDHARRKNSLKRGGDAQQQNYHDQLPVSLPEPVEDLIALDEALSKLSTISPQAAELVQLVYFSGLTLRQSAIIMGISPRSADRLWAYAKAWLRRELRSEQENS